MRVLIVLALLAVPSAQALELSAQGPRDPLAPEAEHPLVLEVTVPCTAVLAHADLQPRLLVTVEAERLIVTGPLSTAIDRQECAGKQELTVVLDYQVRVAGALAEVPIPVHFAAALGEERGETELELAVAYVGAFTAEVLADHKQAAPQRGIPFEIKITNEGNARTVYAFKSAQPMQGNLVVPDPVILEPRGHGTAQAIVVATYVTPYENGPNDAREALRIEIHAKSLEGTPGDNATVDLLADTKGFYVPGPHVLILTLALLVLARRR